jgi:hypothetical protein
MLEDNLDPARLREAGADLVIVHRQQEDGTVYARAVGQLGEPVFEDERFAVFEVPATEAQPAPMTGGFRGGVVEDRAETHFYAPDNGWWTWAAQLEADDREVSLWLDGQILQRVQAGEPETIFAPFPITAGYHTLTLAVEPPCPDHAPEGQICRSVTVRNLALEALAGYIEAPSAALRAPGENDDSVSLRAALPETAAPGGTLRLPLVWTAETARSETDTRFVHVLDENGGLVAQEDGPLGAIPAGESRAEWVTLALPSDLPPGDYRIVAGWYTQPDLVNFCALDGETCAGNEALLGSVRVE